MTITDDSKSPSDEPTIEVTPPTPVIDSNRHKFLSTLAPPNMIVDQETHTEHAYDNPAFEATNPRRSRRISLPSEAHTDVGPVRKKSILHNSHESLPHNSSSNLHLNTLHNSLHLDVDGKLNYDGLRNKKASVSDSMYSRTSKTRFSDVDCDDERSWWYTFCLSCRKKETIPSWQPPGWNRFCPHPYFPSYRQFSRIIALTLIGLLVWGILYAIVGEMAAPGGQLFGLAVLSLAAHFGGVVCSWTTLPGLIGMLIVGIIFQNVGWVNIGGEFKVVVAVIRKIALVIILIRAGLDLDPQALDRLRFTIMKLALIPWFIEAMITTVTGHYLLGLPWQWGLLLGSIIAAVSPAVVVACLCRLKNKGYGVAKGIPTLIIAISGIDDALSVAFFGIISSILFSEDSLMYQIMQGPISIVGGLAYGAVWGWICQFVPEKNDPFAVPLRILLLLGGGMIAIFGSEVIGFEGAGPLGVVAAGFMCSLFWSRQGWDVEDNPAMTAFEIFWTLFEPMLFGLTGAQIKINELDPHIVTIGFVCLIIGIVIRMALTVICGIGCKLNTKEKIFVAFACMSKATVQAALGPVAIGVAKEGDVQYAETVMMVCILSIILSAPFGAIIMTVTGTKLLTKRKQAQTPPPDGWRRSHRPSIRDISIIDEEEERDSPEKIINHIS